MDRRNFVQYFNDSSTHKVVKLMQLGVFTAIFTIFHSSVFDVEQDYKYFKRSFSTSTAFICILAFLSNFQFCLGVNSHCYGRLQAITATFVITLEGFYIWCKDRFPLSNGTIVLCILVGFAAFLIYWDSYFCVYRIYDTSLRRNNVPLIETCVDEAYYIEDSLQQSSSTVEERVDIQSDLFSLDEYLADVESSADFKLPLQPLSFPRSYSKSPRRRIGTKRYRKMQNKSFKLPERRARLRKGTTRLNTTPENKSRNEEGYRFIYPDVSNTLENREYRPQGFFSQEELTEKLAEGCTKLKSKPDYKNLVFSVPTNTPADSHDTDEAVNIIPHGATRREIFSEGASAIGSNENRSLRNFSRTELKEKFEDRHPKFKYIQPDCTNLSLTVPTNTPVDSHDTDNTSQEAVNIIPHEATEGETFSEGASAKDHAGNISS